MTLVRRLARPMLASVFIAEGLDALRNPTSKVPATEDGASSILGRLPYVPQDPEQLVKINAAVQIGAGTLLTLGRFPRLSSILLAASIVPATIAGYRFWEEREPTSRKQKQIHFFKDIGLLGGLLLSAVDTEGRPGLAWRAQHVSHHVAGTSKRARRVARLEAKVAARDAMLAARTARARLPV
jgi:putative oxidoreductase